MYIYRCKNCGKEILYDERDTVFLHRDNSKYYCLAVYTEPHQGMVGSDFRSTYAKTHAEPEIKHNKKVIVADVPYKYAWHPPKSYEQKVHEFWYQQIPDGGSFVISTEEFSATMGRDEYVEYNIRLVKTTAKNVGKKEEDLFRSIYYRLTKDNEKNN